MNYSVIRYLLAAVMKFAAFFLLAPVLVSLVYRESVGVIYLAVAVLCFALGCVFGKKPEKMAIFAAEGLVTVALSWIVISVIGALPLLISGDIPNFTNALFETVSGFTTTGASILKDVEALTHTGLFWRSMTHWFGGMGVIVFILTVMPLTGGHNMHLMRAESPGPSVGKLVPRMRDTAKLLYTIYLILTLSECIVLFIAGMPLFDAICISMGSAGTGGFAVRNAGMGDYSALLQILIGIFICLFGINFNFYFYLIGKHKKDAFRMTEVKGYLLIIALATLAITIDIRVGGFSRSIGECLHHAFFQVATIITTTGFATADFNLWPNLSRTIIVCLMFVGACAGSTGGGIKVSRILIVGKSIKREIIHYIHPRSVRAVRMDGKPIDNDIVHSVMTYLGTYLFLFVLSILLLGLFESTDLETNFTAVASAFNNIGPGLSRVGPTENFAFFTAPAKYVLMFDMLAGRLELYPMLMLLVPAVWKRK